MRRMLSRRTVLRGALGGSAVALALPLLEAMVSDKGVYADGSEPGPIFGVFFWANGLPWHAGHGAEQGSQGHPDLWTPAQTGAGFAPSQLLSPLGAHPYSVITGLEPHSASRGSGVRTRPSTASRTAAPSNKGRMASAKAWHVPECDRLVARGISAACDAGRESHVDPTT